MNKVLTGLEELTLCKKKSAINIMSMFLKKLWGSLHPSIIFAFPVAIINFTYILLIYIKQSPMSDKLFSSEDTLSYTNHLCHRRNIAASLNSFIWEQIYEFKLNFGINTCRTLLSTM